MRYLSFLAAVAPLAVLAAAPPMLSGLGRDCRAATRQSQKRAQGVVGEWMLCRETVVQAKKGGHRSPADTATVITNVCTKIVFKADGKGFAGLYGNAKYEFLWQQRDQAITITYPPTSVDPTRLRAGTYQFTLATIPACLNNPTFVQLALSTGNRTLFLSRIK